MPPHQIFSPDDPLVKGEVPTRLRGRLYFGRMWLPGEDAEMTRELTDRSVTLILNLRESSHGAFAGAAELWHPIDDFGVPTDKPRFLADLDTVIEALGQGQNVFVHCFAGRGRTSLALASLLVRLGVPPENALALVLTLARGPESIGQKEFVRELLEE